METCSARVQEHDRTLWQTLRGSISLPTSAMWLLMHIFVMASLLFPRLGTLDEHQPPDMPPNHTEYMEDTGFRMFDPAVRERLSAEIADNKPYVTVIGFPDTPWNPWETSTSVH